MPRPLIPEYRERTKCRAMMCNNEGTKVCSRCRDAVPRTKYCSEACQKRDWEWHKKYCGKKVYTFKFKLLRSKNPAIKRTVDVPSWFTFEQLHFVLQYAFGPWQNCHLHQFSFYDVDRKDLKSGTFFIDPSKEWLRVLAEGEELDEWPDMPGMPKRQGPRGTMQEKDMKLSDIFDEEGRYRGLVEKDGEVIPLIYLYDFGDNWEHLVTFKGEKMASADRPLFSKAVGYPPAEDAGGVTGWEEVKEAFAAERPTRAQRERRQWAIERMGYEDRNDPLAVGDAVPYSPFNEVNVEVMNYEGRWDNHYRGYSGKEYYDYSYGDESGLSDSDTDLSDVDD